MPQFLEWIGSNFFIVVIIAGALISVFGKKNAKPNAGGEPFGGRGAAPQGQGNPARQPQLPEEERRSPFAGAPANPGQTRTSATQARRETQAQRTDLDQASRQVNAEIEKRLRNQRSMQERSQRVAKDPRQSERVVLASPTNKALNSKPSAAASFDGSAAANFSNPTADELRKGILWAEVLGAPRSRKPYFSRRK